VNELRIDGFFVIAVTAAAILGIGSIKLVALNHHQHPIAQGFLVLF
jgi:hypothetical protein